jgi:hypothetical protein
MVEEIKDEVCCCGKCYFLNYDNFISKQRVKEAIEKNLMNCSHMGITCCEEMDIEEYQERLLKELGLDE